MDRPARPTLEELRAAVRDLGLDMTTWEEARYPADAKMLDGVVARALALREEVTTTLTLHECEHHGDLDHNVREATKFGLTVLKATLLDEYEAGRIKVRGTRAQMIDYRDHGDHDIDTFRFPKL